MNEEIPITTTPEEIPVATVEAAPIPEVIPEVVTTAPEVVPEIVPEIETIPESSPVEPTTESLSSENGTNFHPVVHEDELSPDQLTEVMAQGFVSKTGWQPKIEFRNPNDLIPYIQNGLNHSSEQVDRLAASIAAFGFDQPIVITPDNIIKNGHARKLAAIKLNLTQVPVIVSDHLTEEEVIASRIADNKVREYATWNFDNLKLDLDILKGKEFDTGLTQFDTSFMESLSMMSVARNEEDEKRIGAEGLDKYEASTVRELKFFFTADNYEGVLRRLEEARAQFGLEDYSQLLLSLLDFYEARKTQTQPQ